MESIALAGRQRHARSPFLYDYVLRHKREIEKERFARHLESAYPGVDHHDFGGLSDCKLPQR